MASEALCDPCLDANKSSSALKYCSDCEEKLCNECADFHLHFKAFKGHHLIDFELADSRLPPSLSNYCDKHPDFQLDLFCILHDTVCCCACVPETHNNCKDVLPIKIASKDIKASSLLSDSIKMISYLVETIDKLSKSRENNRTLLYQTKQSIIEQIRDVKVKLLDEIAIIEQRLITDLNSIYRENERKISEEEAKLTVIATTLKEREEQLKFLKDHGSDRQLFITLRHLIQENQQTESRIQDLTADIQEINIEFDKNPEVKIKSIGSIVTVTKPCNVEYRGIHSNVAQVQQFPDNALTEFKLEEGLELKSNICYNMKGIEVTTDNKLFICNYDRYSNVSVYTNYKTNEKEIKLSGPPFDIAIIPKSDRAVVTLPDENAIQFINTKDCTAGEKIVLKMNLGGIAASTDRLFLGGRRNVFVMKHDGSKEAVISTTESLMFGNKVNDLCYNEQKRQLLLRCDENLLCITLHGEEVFRYSIPGWFGVALDHQGYIYLSCKDRNEIHRLSPDGKFCDIVLNADNGIHRPCRIKFNSNFSKFMVVNKNGESVLVYSCR